MLRTETATNIVYANYSTSNAGTDFVETTIKQDAYSNILKNATVIYSNDVEYSIVQNTASSVYFKNKK